MKIRAIWIIDENYLLPAYASICSFLDSNDIPVTLVYCSQKNVKKAKKWFEQISVHLTFETFRIPIEFQNHSGKWVITNRLARMHYAAKYTDAVSVLFDADVLFSNNSNKLIDEISTTFHEGKSSIFGVLDAKIAYRDYLYFNTQDEYGRDVAVPHLMQKDIYTYVFGTNWWHHLKGASINNGVIAFYNCHDVIECWRRFYLRGVSHPNVNPGDDQLPLAAAIYKTNQNVVCLPEKFNSKGDTNGEFAIYHALSGAWKMQLVSAINGEKGVSDFADIAQNVLHKIPNELINSFMTKLNHISPYLYRRLKGRFGFKHLYEDMFNGMNEGVMVEVGMQDGKSACFMLEQIHRSSKNIYFHAFQSESDHDTLTEFLDVVQTFKLGDSFFLHRHPMDDSSPFNDLKEVDFVFLNLDNRYEYLSENLEFWYSKLKPGGFLAGYDYTSQVGLDYGNACATYDFCEKLDLPLRISFDIFIIEKPQPKEYTEASAYHISNSAYE